MQMQRLSTQTQRVSGNVSALRVKAFAPVQRGSLQVVAAITREKKKEIVSNLKEKLDGSLVVFSMGFKGVSVPTFQKLRKSLPESTTIFVCKNNLMKVAINDKPQWTPLTEHNGCMGENAWVFVPEDALQETLKTYYAFETVLFAEAKKTAPKGTVPAMPVEVKTACFENQYITADQLKKVADMPSKKELLATIAGLAKQPATKIASGIKAVPTKLARALALVADLSEDKTLTVASFVKA